MEHIIVLLVDLPHAVKGFTRRNPDDSYTITINARLSAEMQIETYDHEIRHIENGDYSSDLNVDKLEFKRHAV